MWRKPLNVGGEGASSGRRSWPRRRCGARARLRWATVRAMADGMVELKARLLLEQQRQQVAQLGRLHERRSAELMEMLDVRGHAAPGKKMVQVASEHGEVEAAVRESLADSAKANIQDKEGSSETLGGQQRGEGDGEAVGTERLDETDLGARDWQWASQAGGISG